MASAKPRMRTSSQAFNTTVIGSSRYLVGENSLKQLDQASAAANFMQLNELINAADGSSENLLMDNAKMDNANGLQVQVVESYDKRSRTGQSAGMQSYSLFPQTARGLGTGFPRPSSSHHLMNKLNNDLNNLQTAPR